MGRPVFRRVASFLLVGVLLAVVPMAQAGEDCGLPLTSGPAPQTGDCLFVLQAAVGIHECGLCLCDLSGDGEIRGTDSLRCLKASVGQPVDLLCPTCNASTTTSTVTSTTIPPGHCPITAEWTSHAGYGPSCASNADCVAGVCDEAAGRCHTSSNLDMGWTGLLHDSDGSEGFILGLRLDCDGQGPLCGECSVAGVDPSFGACRCSNDTRTICTQPFAEAAAECSGLGRCDCFDGPPLPVSGGGVPVCLVPLLAEDVSGQVNVDTGAALLHKPMRLRGHLGLGTRFPCPTCGGTCDDDPEMFCDRDEDCSAGTCNLDPIANDGIRGGVCSSYPGADSGKPCDVQALHSSFPAHFSGGSGGGYSLDCHPNNNITGQGWRIDQTETTGASRLLSGLSCQGISPDLDCACLTCSSDPTVPCDSDETCAGLEGSCSKSTTSRCTEDQQCFGVDVGPCSQGIGRCSRARTSEFTCATNSDCLNRDVGPCLPSLCTSKGTGLFPRPNSCTDLLCSDVGDETGECATGPEDRFCSGIVQANGKGILACVSDDSCAPHIVGPPGAWPCNTVQRRSCFLDPIEAHGNADPYRPATVAIFCMAPSSNSGVNDAMGLPGPARLRRQASLRLACPGEAGQAYVPGVGCPP